VDNTELNQALESALQHLNRIDPGGINDISWQVSNRILYRKLQALPMPLKLALIQGPVSVVFFAAFPPPPESPPLVIPLIWIASYCTALIVGAFVPRRQHRPTAHWVQRPPSTDGRLQSLGEG
jgi:hypothetical protein